MLVFPSAAPHIARPVIETGAIGKLVVASRIGGVEELVIDGETGLLVPPGNSQALAKAMIHILSDVNDSQRMGQNGLTMAQQHFNAKTKLAEIVEVYRQLV